MHRSSKCEIIFTLRITLNVSSSHAWNELFLRQKQRITRPTKMINVDHSRMRVLRFYAKDNTGAEFIKNPLKTLVPSRGKWLKLIMKRPTLVKVRWNILWLYESSIIKLFTLSFFGKKISLWFEGSIKNNYPTIY